MKSLLRLPLLVLWATLIASGGYVFVYLYRWQWTRTLTSAAIFIAAEVALVTLILIRRLNKLGERIDHLDHALTRMPGPTYGESVRHWMSPPEGIKPDRPEEGTSNVAPSNRWFAWLSEGRDSTSVFVPILLGAGVIVSAIAWLVERIARATARSASGASGSLANSVNFADQLEVLAPPDSLLWTPELGQDVIRWPAARP